MKIRPIIWAATFVISLIGATTQAAPNTQKINSDQSVDQRVIKQVLNTKKLILKNSNGKSQDDFIFLAFWDFDGTILKGDCSEGLTEKGSVIYPGLAQVCIESGMSSIYKPETGFPQYLKDYRHMENAIGEWLAYPFIPQMLRGAKADEVSAIAAKQFSKTYKHYYFKKSLNILKRLESESIQNHIISASAELFVKGSSESLGLHQSRLNGIKLAIKDGKVTPKIIYPVTWNEGKTQKIKLIIEEMQHQHPNKTIIVLAGFGNSYNTDGSFLKYIATQELPAGQPMCLMINGGKVKEAYKGLFINATFREIEIP